MKRVASAVALLAFHIPQATLARNVSPSRRVIDIKRQSLQNPASATPSTSPTQSVPAIDIDTGKGKSLAQLLSELNAEVDWSNERLGTIVVQGGYHGSPQAIAQAALGDLNYAIFYHHSRLRITVMAKTPPIETEKPIPSATQAERKD